MAYGWTRQQMEQHIAEGRSIMVDGNIITDVSQLPVESYAPEEASAKRTRLQKELDDLNAVDTSTNISNESQVKTVTPPAKEEKEDTKK